MRIAGGVESLEHRTDRVAAGCAVRPLQVFSQLAWDGQRSVFNAISNGFRHNHEENGTSPNG
jgi:hypothetical protein